MPPRGVHGAAALVAVALAIAPPASAPQVHAWGRWTAGATSAADGSPTTVADLGSAAASIVLGGGAQHLVAAAPPASAWDAQQVLAVGSNTYRQLGAASSAVLAPAGATVGDGSLDLVAASASNPHCFAGSVYDAFCDAIGMDACADGGCIPLTNTTDGSRLSAVSAAQLAAGHSHTLLLTSNGEVWGWGRNLEGQLGESSSISPTVAPGRLPLGLAAQQGGTIGRGVYVSAGHYKSAVVVGGRLQISVTSEGQLDSWSGGGSTPANFGLRVSIEVAGVSVFPAQAMRGHVVVVIDQLDGSVISQNQYNTMDAGDSAANDLVSDIAALPDGRIVVVATAESGATHIAIVADTLRSLGADAAVDAGQYGSWALVGVSGFNGEQWVEQAWAASGTGPTTVDASVPLGGYPGPSEVWACGLNLHGELGRGADAIADFPTDEGFVLATSLSSLAVVAIELGREHSAVLTGDGSLYGMGSNEGGQLGVGTALCTDDLACTSPVPIQSRTSSAMLENVAAIAAGDHHTLALLTDGTLYCTGLNAHGECGLGHRDPVDVFTQVPGLAAVAFIAAGGRHSLAVRNNGRVKGWGWNYHGRKQQSASAAFDTAEHFLTADFLLID